MTEFRTMINGIPVTAYYSQRAIDSVFLPLLRHLTALQRQKGKRVLALLAAPPGCGKTTLGYFLEKLSGERQDLVPIQAIGMDGFHKRQEYLKSHFMNSRFSQSLAVNEFLLKYSSLMILSEKIS